MERSENMEEKFNELRNKYNEFIYDKYDIKEENNSYIITYYFTIPNLITFTPMK